jgi:hypothetical protein
LTDLNSISCAECQSRLEEFALDELNGELRVRVEQHLIEGCSACNQHLADMLSEFAALAHSLPNERPPQHVERALRNRIAVQSLRREALAGTDSHVSTAVSSPKSLTRRLVSVAVALAATIIGIAIWANRHKDLNGTTTSADPWADVQRRVEQADASQHFSTIPRLRFASFGTHSPKDAVEGYIVEDRLAKQWHVYVFHLPALPAGRGYQLWFDAGDSHFVRAGSAVANDDGTISCVVDLPKDVPAVRGLAISDEANADAEQPSRDNLVEAPLPNGF